MPNSTAPADWISLAEARRDLGVSPETLRKLVEAGRISARSVPGARPRVLRSDVVRLLEDSTRQAHRQD